MKPDFYLKYSNLGFGNAFVHISASYSSLVTYVISISPLLYKSCKRWYLTSICLLLFNFTAQVLSTHSIYLNISILHSRNIFYSHIISFAPEAALTYSASVVDRAIHCCRLHCHVMVAFAYLHTTPDVDFLVSLSPA